MTPLQSISGRCETSVKLACAPCGSCHVLAFVPSNGVYVYRYGFLYNVCLLSLYGYVFGQRELQQGAFMVLCLRCHLDGLSPAQQQLVADKLQAKTVADKMHALLQARQRRPFPSEFPIVGGSDVQDVETLLQEMCGRLEEIMGCSAGFQVGY